MKAKIGILVSLFLVSLIGLAGPYFPYAKAYTKPRPPRPPTTTVVPTTTTIGDLANVDDQCRENGPGRQHAIADLWAYKATWSQANADAIVADVDRFVSVCNGALRTEDVIRTGNVARQCLLDWTGYLPSMGACYMPPGNEINPYNSALLNSSG